MRVVNHSHPHLLPHHHHHQWQRDQDLLGAEVQPNVALVVPLLAWLLHLLHCGLTSCQQPAVGRTGCGCTDCHYSLQSRLTARNTDSLHTTPALLSSPLRQPTAGCLWYGVSPISPSHLNLILQLLSSCLTLLHWILTLPSQEQTDAWSQL